MRGGGGARGAGAREELARSERGASSSGVWYRETRFSPTRACEKNVFYRAARSGRAMAGENPYDLPRDDGGEKARHHQIVLGHSSARVTRRTLVRRSFGAHVPRDSAHARVQAPGSPPSPTFPIPIVRAPQWFSIDLAPAHLRRRLRDGHASPRQRAAGVPRPLPPHQPPRVLQRHRGWGVPDLLVQRCEPTARAVARIHPRAAPSGARRHGRTTRVDRRASRPAGRFRVSSRVRRRLDFFSHQSSRFRHSVVSLGSPTPPSVRRSPPRAIRRRSQTANP